MSFLKVEVEIKCMQQSCDFIGSQIAPTHGVGGHTMLSIIQEISPSKPRVVFTGKVEQSWIS